MSEHTYILTYNSLFIYMHTDRQTDIQADRQTDSQTDRKTDRQTDRQTDRHSGYDGGRGPLYLLSLQISFFVIGEKVKKMLKVKEIA